MVIGSFCQSFTTGGKQSSGWGPGARVGRVSCEIQSTGGFPIKGGCLVGGVVRRLLSHIHRLLSQDLVFAIPWSKVNGPRLVLNS